MVSNLVTALIVLGLRAFLACNWFVTLVTFLVRDTFYGVSFSFVVSCDVIQIFICNLYNIINNII